MANLFPTSSSANSAPLDNSRQTAAVGYKQSVNFDNEKGDFTRDGQYRLTTATGVEAWKQWCQNCLETERYAFASYSTDFGINTKLIFALPDTDSQEIMLKKEIEEALMADDYKRTKAVTDFEFNWIAPDAVEVTLTIQGIDDAKIDMTVTIGG